MSEAPVTSLQFAKTHLASINAVRKSATPGATGCLQPLVDVLTKALHEASIGVGSNEVGAMPFTVDVARLMEQVTENLVPVAQALANQGGTQQRGGIALTAPSQQTPLPRGFTDDEILCSTATPVSFVSPRGKFTVHALRDKFALESATPKGTTTYLINHKDVRKVLALQRGDSNDTSDVMIALDGKAALTVGKQRVKTLLAQVRGKDKPLEVVKRKDMGLLDARLERGCTDQDGGTTRNPGQALVAFLEMATGAQKASRPKLTGNGGFAGVANKGCVKANLKFNQGFLFLVPDGFAFVDRPSLWLPFSQIADLRLGRAEGVGSTFDLSVTLDEGEGETLGGDDNNEKNETREFANISREELEGVRRYLAKNCVEKGEEDDGDEKETTGTAEMMEDSENDNSDEDDEDFGVDENSETDDDDDDEEEDNSDGGNSEGISEGNSEEEDEEEASDAGEDVSDGSAGVTLKLGSKRARDETKDADAIPGTGTGDAEEDETEDEESDEDGAFEVVAR